MHTHSFPCACGYERCGGINAAGELTKVVSDAFDPEDYALPPGYRWVPRCTCGEAGCDGQCDGEWVAPKAA